MDWSRSTRIRIPDNLTIPREGNQALFAAFFFKAAVLNKCVDTVDKKTLLPPLKNAYFPPIRFRKRLLRQKWLSFSGETVVDRSLKIMLENTFVVRLGSKLNSTPTIKTAKYLIKIRPSKICKYLSEKTGSQRIMRRARARFGRSPSQKARGIWSKKKQTFLTNLPGLETHR